MLGFSNFGEVAVFLHTGVHDMRIGFDRLAAQIEEQCQRSVVSGGIFVFFSRTRDRVRLFYWERDGYAMWTKRLEAGSFRVERKEGYEEITAVDLESLLEGVDLSRIKLRKSLKKGENSYCTSDCVVVQPSHDNRKIRSTSR